MSVIAVVVAVVLTSPVLEGSSPLPGQAPDEQRQLLAQKVRELRDAFVRVRVRIYAQPTESDGERLRQLLLGIDQRVTAVFRNADVADILSFLSRTAGITIQVSDDVDRRVRLTVEFTNADFASVFNYVLDAAQLAARRIDEKTVLISPRR